MTDPLRPRWADWDALENELGVLIDDLAEVDTSDWPQPDRDTASELRRDAEALAGAIEELLRLHDDSDPASLH